MKQPKYSGDYWTVEVGMDGKHRRVITEFNSLTDTWYTPFEIVSWVDMKPESPWVGKWGYPRGAFDHD